jgi:hypothetical protein
MSEERHKGMTVGLKKQKLSKIQEREITFLFRVIGNTS